MFAICLLVVFKQSEWILPLAYCDVRISSNVTRIHCQKFSACHHLPEYFFSNLDIRT